MSGIHVPGVVITGPYVYLDDGEYTVLLRLDGCDHDMTDALHDHPGVLEVVEKARANERENSDRHVTGCHCDECRERRAIVALGEY